MKDKSDNEKYEPQAKPIVKECGEATTDNDIKGAVTVPDYPADADKQPEIKVDVPTQLPDGNTPGEYEVDVTVTYPYGSIDTIPWNKLVFHRDDEGAAENDKPAEEALIKILKELKKLHLLRNHLQVNYLKQGKWMQQQSSVPQHLKS